MKKQLSLLTLSIALLSALSTTHIQSATELPHINIEACKKLWKAAENGNLERAQQALAEGAHINMYAEYVDDNPYRYKLPLSIPLWVATLNGHPNVVQFLLNQGAMTEAKLTSNGDTPLVEISTRKGLSRPIVKAIITELLIHKANVNAQHFCFKSTPLSRVIYTLNDESIAKQLILAGADIFIKDHKSKTASDKITTPSMREAFAEAYITRALTTQQLNTLEKTMHTEMLKNLNVPVEDLAILFSNFVPYYKSYQVYVPLNQQVSEQFAHMKEKLEIIRLLNQPECLPVQSVAAITADYLFSEQQ